MGLIAWYPLNGDTKDYSGNGNDADNAGAKITSEGKIGQAYSFENNSSGINIRNQNFDHLSEYTMSAWVKPKGNHRNYNGAIISSGNWNSQAWSFGLSQDNARIDVASNRYNVYVDYKVPLNEWTHITSIMKDNIAKVYVNGEFIAQRSATAQLQSNASNTFIGRETYAGGYFSFNGDLNDIRVYDHALSEKEISEIAKAKILHYTFDDPYSEPTENIHPNPEFESNWGSWDSSTVTYENKEVLGSKTRTATLRTRANGSSNAIHQRVDGYSTDKMYTLSAYVRIRPEEVVEKALIKLYINRYEDREVTKEWTRISTTQLVRAGINTTHITQITLCNFEICCVQVEEKDNPTPFTADRRGGGVRDKSGYRNHAVLNQANTPQWTEYGRIGKGAYAFDYQKETIRTPSIGNFSETMTFSAWFNSKNIARPQNIYSVNGPYFVRVVNGKMRWSILAGGWKFGTGNKSLSPDTWYHVAMVYDKASLRGYINGELDYLIELSSPIASYSSRPVNIGYTTGGEDAPFDGVIDDTRIYATSLSEADIKELYQSRANVDDKGSLTLENVSEIPVNICPPFEKWVLTGGAYVEEGRLVLPKRGARAETPFVYVGKGNSANFSMDFFSENARPERENLGGFLRGSNYYDINKKATRSVGNWTGNGNAGTYPTKKWSRSSWRPAQGNEIAYVKFNISNNSSYTAEEYMVSRPMITLNNNTSNYLPYTSKEGEKDERVSLDDKGSVRTTEINEVGLPIRYIRERMNGSNKNTSSHWTEVEAYDSSGTNVALGAKSNHSYHTDGNTNSNPYTSVAPLVDLGEVRTIIYLKMYHYYADARIYNDIVTEVSADGVNWKVVFDSNVDGQYVETKDGNKIYLYPDKMSISDKGELFVRELKEVVY